MHAYPTIPFTSENSLQIFHLVCIIAFFLILSMAFSITSLALVKARHLREPNLNCKKVLIGARQTQSVISHCQLHKPTGEESIYTFAVRIPLIGCQAAVKLHKLVPEIIKITGSLLDRFYKLHDKKN